ncbi:hypothetical protein ACFQRD_09200 [Brachybacterium sp. GCM10030268]|uniref:hypothetical protein n=1 Tax=Brachybacterium sp. GCM10030268 TaxID=3273382 RepID=UPI00361D5254
MTIDYAHGTGPDDLSDIPEPRVRQVPWFLGDAPTSTTESADAARPAAMAVGLDQLPFFRTMRHLVDFIGEGRRLTKRGDLFAVDRRQVERSIFGDAPIDTWWRHRGDSLTQFVWSVLIRHGVLLRADGSVRVSEGHRASSMAGTVPGLDVDEAESMIEIGLEHADVGTGLWFGGTGGVLSEDSLDALLVASGPDGLVLPDHPGDAELIHCSETVHFLVGLLRHPHIRDVPIDRRTGHVVAAELWRLVRVSLSMDNLVSRGLVLGGGCDDEAERDLGRTYRAPVEVRGAVARMRERRAATDLGDGS